MSTGLESAEAAVRDLLELMARLRTPLTGCAWDIEQTFATIAPYTIEEAYEVADAIASGDMDHLREELGDLLFQVVFHARMAEEAGAFDFADVARALVAKMVRRHPHVFEKPDGRTASQQTSAWEAQKAAERAAAGSGARGVLDGVPVALPALTRAVKLSSRAAGVGFAWARLDDVLEKLAEEIAELGEEVRAGDQAKIEEELGDVLFVCANIARHLCVDPENALRIA
ncbi:MAG: nucleoside triphosphate pyrophosphohydrolase, partial [Caulobacteraceae bacterium]|nr:nucleoside triphosphate pyrophosphohydrolase [Caulobacteraceae bacterium]